MDAAGINRLLSKFLLGISVFTFMAAGFGCAGLPARHPVPAELTNMARITDIPSARFWGDEWSEYSIEMFENFTDSDFQDVFSGIYNKPHNYLAISGGGANGAFGAGLLVGWTAAGTRPEFTMVTGISTGALTAPFAFLGPEYDEILKEVYTTISTRDIGRKRGLIASFFSDSMIDTQPLRHLIARYVTDEIVEAIAREHKKGRRLFIGTENLDAGRPVIWNLGAVAASEHPRKLELIYDILQASSAIPVAFPPVVIRVEADGQSYDEMHVDGGTGTQVFVYPAAMDWKLITEKLKVQGHPNVYVIRNSFLIPDFDGVQRSILPIGIRSIDSLIRTQGIGDLYQIYTLCKRDGNDFNLAYIPADFSEEPSEGFDPVYMGKLFDYGYLLARNGYPWAKSPPGFETIKINSR